jgi:ABC-2 type transport system permease protein
MNFQRIWGVVLRHIHLAFRDLSRLSWMFYWPVFDIVSWGFSGLWVQKYNAACNIGTAQLVALVLLQLVGRTALEISGSLMEELWSMNMINIFASPITLPEWISSGLIIGLMSNTVLFVYCTLIVWLVFGVNVMSVGLLLLLFAIPLIISGLWIGFMAAILLITFGARVQTFVFILNWTFTPFCGVFFPVDILPTWGQAISVALPMTYIFSALRNYILTGNYQWNVLAIGTAMACIYALITCALFFVAFNKSKQKGLARLTAE